MANFQMNVFGMGAIKGMVDLLLNPSIMSAQIDVTSTLGADGGVGLVAGQAVTIVNSPGGIPKVIEATADTQDIFGFIVYNPKDPKYMRQDRCEIAFGKGSVVYMEANAAIARNAEVAVLIAGVKVITATATDRIVGRALDAATAQGQMIRVLIDLPGAIKA